MIQPETGHGIILVPEEKFDRELDQSWCGFRSCFDTLPQGRMWLVEGWGVHPYP